MTKKKAKSILCRCGHQEMFHGKVGMPIWDEWCNGGRIRDRKKGEYVYICTCFEYRPDNLGHIEALAKKRKLI